MTPTNQPHTANPDVDADLDAEAAQEAEMDAKFAAYVEELAASVNDPVHGEAYREMLADDREDLRNVFELCEAICAPRPVPPNRWYHNLIAYGFVITLLGSIVIWILTHPSR